MTYAEIKNRLWALYNNYKEQAKSYTSIQRRAFDARFSKDNNVVATSGNGLSISLPSPIIDDVGVVEDVVSSREEIGFWTKKEKEYPHIVLTCDMDRFSFSTKSHLAYRLKKGDKIHFTGKVKAYVSSYEDISVTICPNSPFSINFFKL